MKQILRGLLGAIAGAILAMAIVLLPAKSYAREGFILMLPIGLAVGYGVRLAVKVPAGQFPRLIGAVVTAVAVLITKWWLADILSQNRMGPEDWPVTPQSMQADIAYSLFKERKDNGEKFAVEPAINARRSNEYPPGIWDDAAAIWNQFSAEKQQRILTERLSQIREIRETLREEARNEFLAASFGWEGILSGILAILLTVIIARPRTPLAISGDQLQRVEQKIAKNTESDDIFLS